MIPDIQQKYEKLSNKQKEIFAGYGLRQVKHFVEISLPHIESVLPAGAQVQGINAEGKVQAINPHSNHTYLWISDLQWQQSNRATQSFDSKEDILSIWRIFELQNYQLVDLSHVHRDFLASFVQA